MTDHLDTDQGFTAIRWTTTNSDGDSVDHRLHVTYYGDGSMQFDLYNGDGAGQYMAAIANITVDAAVELRDRLNWFIDQTTLDRHLAVLTTAPEV